MLPMLLWPVPCVLQYCCDHSMSSMLWYMSGSASSAGTRVNCLQVEVARAVGPTSGLAGVAEAPEGVGDALAAAREDHRSRRMLVQRSDSARMGPLEVFPEVA